MSAIEDQRSERRRYSLAIGIALLGLGPNVVLASSFLPVQQQIAAALGTSTSGVGLGTALGNAAYAVGAVVCAQLALRHRSRRIFLIAEALFVAASAVVALAPDLLVFTGGHVLQGLTAGAMLITALPPLVTRFGARRVPLSAGIVDLGIFGASTLGPVIGGVAAGGDGWRWLVAGAALLAVLGWVVAYRGYDRWDPPDPDRPVDTRALLLVAVGTPALFLAASSVTEHGLASVPVLVPAVVGVALVVATLVGESRREDPLIPVRSLTTMLPVIGLVAAMLGGAAVVTSLDLVQTGLAQVEGKSPGAVAAEFWPTPVGALVGAALLWRLFRTRWVPVLVEAGLLALAVGALLARTWTGPSLGIALLLLGFGASSTVSPGLFLTGLGLRSSELGRAFALVQLLRSIATYAVAPVALAVALRAAVPAAALRTGLLVVAVGCAAGMVVLLALLVLSGGRLRRPDLDAWLEGEKGLPSPATAAHLRPGVDDEEAAPLRPRRMGGGSRGHRHL